MARCAHCAEEYGWRQVWREQPCAFCRRPVELDHRGRIRTWASANETRVLQGPRGRRYWALLAVATVVTGVGGVLPTGGILQATLLPIVQVALIERAMHRYRTHLAFLQSTADDFFSTLVLMVFFVIQAASALFLEVGAAFVTVPVFLLVWGILDAAARRYFRQTARGEWPGIVEMAGMSTLLGLVVVPPVVLLGAVAWSLAGGAT